MTSAILKFCVCFCLQKIHREAGIVEKKTTVFKKGLNESSYDHVFIHSKMTLSRLLHHASITNHHKLWHSSSLAK